MPLQRQRPTGVVADVGCDHGYLALALTESGRQVVAVDICAAPLERAKELFAEQGRSADFVLGDGVPRDVETACVCGLGGSTIAKIVAEAASAKTLPRRFVLQPTPQFIGQLRTLRLALSRQGYKVTKELWRDDNKGTRRDGRYLVTICADLADVERPSAPPELELLVGAQAHAKDTTPKARHLFLRHHINWLATLIEAHTTPLPKQKVRRLARWHGLLEDELLNE